MYHVTEACKQALNNPKRQTELYIKMLKADGSIIEIEGPKDIRLGSFSIDSQLWGNTFQLGTCVSSDMSVTLDNVDGKWRVDEILGATLMPFIKVNLGNALIESIPMGVFIIDRPGQPYNVLTIQAADRLVLLDEPLKDAVNSINGTNGSLLQAICNYCKVPVSTHTLEALNLDYQIKLNEIPDNMSCRDAVSEIALMAGGFARMNRQGELEIITLDASNQLGKSNTWGQQRTKKNTWGVLKTAGKRWVGLNGLVNRTTYGKLKLSGVTWGDLKSRGIPWKLLSDYGLDSEELKETWIMLPATRYDLVQDTEPLKITGMTYKSLQWGDDNYILSLNDLQLLSDADAESVLTMVWQKLKGLSYTPFSSSYIGNPALDTGDIVYHLDRKGGAIASYVGKHTYKHHAKSKISSGGKSKQELNYKSANVRRLASVAAKAEKYTDKHLSSYKQETAQLADLMAQALGVYGPTQVEQDNGASYWYMHDKPKLEESKVLWRFDGTSLGISDDGGKTWSGGITAQSKLIMRVIEAVKVRAELVTLSSQTSLEQYVQGNEQTVKEHTTQINTLTTDITAGRINLTSQTTGNLAGMQLNARSLNFDDGKSFFTITNDGHSDFIESGHYLNGIKTPNFKLKSDGSLWAQGATIEGEISTSGIVEGKINTTTLMGGHIAFDYDNAMCGFMGTGVWTGQGNLKNVQITHSAGSSIVIASRASGFTPYIIFSDGYSFNPNHTDAKIVVNTPIALQENVYISNGKTLYSDAINCKSLTCSSISIDSIYGIHDISHGQSLGDFLDYLDSRIRSLGA